MLTNTFFKIVADEAAEIQFRRTVLTFQGVKGDSIFAYPPRFNMLALAVLLCSSSSSARGCFTALTLP